MDYSQVITETEKKYNLKPGILKKLIEVESSNNPAAISKAGAIGLTQLMPATASELGVDPTDPLQNIDGGARYLRKNLDRFGGDYSQAIAGYNAGPNNKAVLSRDWKMLPAETKGYVNKFMDFLVSPAGASEQIAFDNTPQIQWDEPDTSLEGNIQWDEPNDTTIHPGVASSVGTGFADWGTLGFADELMGLAGGIGSKIVEPDSNFSESYKSARDQYRQHSDRAWDEHPVAYGSGAVAGGIASPINKLTSAMTPVKAGITTGYVAGIGNADELSDVPKTAVIGAGTGGVVGQASKSVVDGLTQLRNDTLINSTASEINKATTNVLRKSADVTGTGSVNNPRIAEEILTKSKSNVKNAYDNLATIAGQSGHDIPVMNVKPKLLAVLHNDKTAFNDISKNADVESAIAKITSNTPITPKEAATLHQHLSRVTGIDGETQFAIKQAQTALSRDITSTGNKELVTALDNARTLYAKDISMNTLNDEIMKHLVPTENGMTFNYKALSTGLKRWSLSKAGKQAIEFNPELKNDITKIQQVIAEHGELKNLTNPPQAQSFLAEIFGTNFDDILSKNIGGIAGGVVGGAPGAFVGQGVQYTGRLVKRGVKELVKAGLQTKPADELYRKSLQTKLGR